MKVAVIGGGAAGFFAAIAAKENHPEAQVCIYEKTTKILSKVKVSGGGRCNVTNGVSSMSDLAKAYPRGGKKLKKAFRVFNNQHTMEWFEAHGVPLKIEASNHVFPVSDSSQSIIDCFLKIAERLGIAIYTKTSIEAIEVIDNQILLKVKNGNNKRMDKVIIATGGSAKKQGFDWLEALGHEIENPVPSLFTFNMPKEPIRKLMGVAANALVTIQGTKLKQSAPLLITHWGMSGPAILKLSAFGARILSDINYQFKAQVNWTNIQNTNVVMENLQDIVKNNPQKLLQNVKPYGLPERLWLFLLEKAELSPQKKWNELGKKGLNKLISILTFDIYDVNGKTTFKEEFVTCGGVSLESINFETMESRVFKNLYFAGEVLNIDGITGGYNFQAAWTTGFIAGQLG
ncbi:MAG: putative Rossmann fold flavoprotein [Saprospiraceae bacterium]|jgi:predicted Rossmann fold flavoprotein